MDGDTEEDGYREKEEEDEEEGGDLVAVEETDKGEQLEPEAEQQQDATPITPLSLAVSERLRPSTLTVLRLTLRVPRRSSGSPITANARLDIPCR
jgi:hypothetical protein